MSKKVDLVGQRFGKLTVIQYVGLGERSNGKKYCNWLCKCDCGNETIVRTSYLTCGETRSCGCLQSEVVKHHYEGMKFGKLTVMKEDGRDPNGCVIWLCECDCGNEFRTTSTYLKRGFSTSCGCDTKNKMIKSHKTHGESNDKLYRTWQNMKNRCYYPQSREYHNYGGRGIIVCQEWKQDYTSFRDWAFSNGYDPNLKFGECTLDRINVNGNYEPNNCRWITNKEQQNNRRDNQYIEYHDEIKTLTEWSNILGINASTLRSRINISHWSIKKAFETPVKSTKK